MEELAPDPRLVKLRRELEQARTQGCAFDAVWAPAGEALSGYIARRAEELNLSSTSQTFPAS